MHQVGETLCHILHLSDGTEIRISPEKAKEWWFILNAQFGPKPEPIYYHSPFIYPPNPPNTCRNGSVGSETTTTYTGST